MVRGIPRFDGLAVGEITVNYLANIAARKEGEPPTISAKAGFISSETGATHGWTAAGGSHGGPRWSNRVYEKAEELRLLLEQELAQRHFREGATEVEEETIGDEGIGEYAASVPEAPQA